MMAQAISEAEKASASRVVERRYDRIAWMYDFFDAPMSALGGRQRRQRVVQRAKGSTLEVGIGTGLNLELYDPSVQLTGIDLSNRMLARAQQRAEKLERPARLLQADVEKLPFPDGAFDSVVATCVFCSVAHPVDGLRELKRVVKPGGQVLLLEHVRPESPFLGWVADRISPLTKRVMGPEMNRRTEENVARSGLKISEVRREAIWREIIAYPS